MNDASMHASLHIDAPARVWLHDLTDSVAVVIGEYPTQLDIIGNADAVRRTLLDALMQVTVLVDRKRAAHDAITKLRDDAAAGDEGARDAVNDMHRAGDHSACAVPAYCSDPSDAAVTL